VDLPARQRHPTRRAFKREAASSAAAELAVARWIAAFNARDLDAMLAWTHPDVELHPLWLSGLRRTYRGHDGIRCWLAALQLWRHQHRIDLIEISSRDDGQLLAVGTLSHKPSANPTPFCALHRIADELIVIAHHHMSDPDSLLELCPAGRTRP
jgi:ketosteroid isomerase-like protein